MEWQEGAICSTFKSLLSVKCMGENVHMVAFSRIEQGRERQDIDQAVTLCCPKPFCTTHHSQRPFKPFSLRTLPALNVWILPTSLPLLDFFPLYHPILSSRQAPSTLNKPPAWLPLDLCALCCFCLECSVAYYQLILALEATTHLSSHQGSLFTRGTSNFSLAH